MPTKLLLEIVGITVALLCFGTMVRALWGLIQIDRAKKRNSHLQVVSGKETEDFMRRAS